MVELGIVGMPPAPAGYGMFNEKKLSNTNTVEIRRAAACFCCPAAREHRWGGQRLGQPRGASTLAKRKARGIIKSRGCWVAVSSRRPISRSG